MKRPDGYTHSLLPAATQEKLIEASMIEPRTPCALSHERTRKLDSVIRLARLRHPHAFRRDA